MNRQYLEDVVKKHCRNIAKHAGKIPGTFEKEDIHDLRVEYKKVRAFLRMLQEELTSGKKLEIPGQLKDVYQCAGDVRDLQLFIVLIDSSNQEAQSLTFYSSFLRKKLFASKEKLVKSIEDAPFRKIEENIVEHLPKELQEANIRKFVHRKVAAIHIILLAVETDEDLHSIRKHLKDIIYNIRIFQNDLELSFPITAWKSEKTLNDMATLLGDYNDKCIAISFLKENLPAGIPDEEKNLLSQILENWEADKENQKVELINKVRSLKLDSDF